MSRPGFVHDVDRSTPPVLFWHGDTLTTERLPAGSRVVYAPELSKKIVDAKAAVVDAIANPVLGEPLKARLRPDMRLTIVFDDSAYPLFRTKGQDNRRRIIEAVLDLAADAGVDDVELVVARGLRRRMTETELIEAIGERVYDSFAPKGLLKHHDAENHEELIPVATLETGEPIEINKRVATSDLVVYAGTSLTPHDTGWHRIITGLSTYATIGDGSDERLDHVCEQASPHLKVFQVDATIDLSYMPSLLSFLSKREREWNALDKARFAIARETLSYLPPRFRRQLLNGVLIPQHMTSVVAGDVDAVGKTIATRLHEERNTPVTGQSDIVTFGVPSFAPYGTGSISNPVLMAGAGLGKLFSLHEGRPLVRDGGVAILHHPARPKFHTVHHPSDIDFFQEVLEATNDINEMADYESRFANDAWFKQLYQTSYAFHGAHPFQTWREVSRTRARLGGVIVVGGHAPTVRKLGFKPASTFQDALEMAGDITGSREPSLTHLHAPPLFTAAVS